MTAEELLVVKDTERAEGDLIVSVRNFGVTFRTFGGRIHALEDINLEIREGDSLGIIGESGSGKTTLATAIMGMLPDNAEVSGEIRVRGKTVSAEDISGARFRSLPRRQRKILTEKLLRMRWKDISMVFQGSMNAFNPAYTIEKQIREVFLLHTNLSDRQIAKRTVQVVEEAGLNRSVLKAFPHELSGGMKQRAVIAMALALSPSLIIADEPTTGLDVVIQAKIIQELKKVKENRKRAVMVISHDLGVVSQLASRVAVMYAGKIMEIGPTWDVYTSPHNPYTRELIRSYPSLERTRSRIEGIPGQVISPSAERKGCYFANRCFMADERCFNEHPQLREISPGRYSRCHYAERVPGLQADEQSRAVQTSSPVTGRRALVAENLKMYFTLRTSVAGALYSREKGARFVRAVDNVSLEVKKGEIFGIIGESGSGKTTMIRVLMKLLEATSGKVIYWLSDSAAQAPIPVEGGGNGTLVDAKQYDTAPDGDGGLEITAVKEKDRRIKIFRRRAQMIFQDPYDSIDPSMSVYDVINEPLIAHRLTNDPLESMKLIKEALTTVSLIPPESYFERFSYELSGGERQRVAAARALVLRPDFIAMDEPISMLDVSLRAGFLNLILEMREKLGITVLYITHDIASARYVCDRLLVLYLGVGVEGGMSEDVIREPLHPYTKALLKAIPKPSRDWNPAEVRIIGEIGNAIEVPKGCRFAKRCVYAQEICWNTPPPERASSNGHWYLCHFSQEELKNIDAKGR